MLLFSSCFTRRNQNLEVFAGKSGNTASLLPCRYIAGPSFLDRDQALGPLGTQVHWAAAAGTGTGTD